MTDHPRFQTADSGTDERYREYHGAPQVELVFRLVDWWLGRRQRRPADERQFIQFISGKPTATERLSS